MKKLKAALKAQIAQADFLKLLAHPVRIAILQILSEGEACVCHLEAFLGYPQPYLSQQLAVLRSGGIISDRRDGWNVYYTLQQPHVINLLNTLSAFITPSLEDGLLQKVSCSCPKCNPPFPQIAITQNLPLGAEE